MPANSGIADV